MIIPEKDAEEQINNEKSTSLVCCEKQYKKFDSLKVCKKLLANSYLNTLVSEDLYLILYRR